MAAERVLIVDVGTSSVKAVLFDGHGHALRVADRPVATEAPQPGFAEQASGDWWQATVEAVAELAIDHAIDAISLSGSMQNVIVLGRDGAPLRPAILYSDARVDASRVAAVGEGLPADFEARIGNRIDPALCLYRLDWLHDHEPEIMAAASRILFGAKDAVILAMTGRAVVDPSTATTTGLMNLAGRNWDATILGAIGLSPALLPDILEADALAGPLLPGAAAALGLPASIPVHVGAGDGGATAWGTASEAHDRPHAYLGTTGWIAAAMPLETAAPPRASYTLAAPVGNDVVVISPFLAAGLAIDWFAHVAGRSVPELYGAAATHDAEPPSALFLPFLIGERGPFIDRAVRGAFLGLDRAQQTEALAYAVLEGLAFAIRDNLDALPVRPRAIVLAGGVAGAAVVAQLVADVTGAVVEVPPESRLVTAYGAYRMLAPVIGATSAPEAGSRIVTPRPERAGRAARRFTAYRGATEAARSLTADL
ncbi:xylulose kinase [Mesorhizobium sp. BR1-1-16]|uniref:FGGY family carbohydrate kinase n=1 Tax=Mesorhizobium sp. BR1-1-16 TaxID=2876653 RepID=UPI001CCC2DA3|nr:FGGY family carbohydrate kinase [Mesorhizobium sp. BR1-1-16]MBZ9937093.1 xylulose kinase [Mesorhizobium sp. BR1-1-16]